MRIPDDHTAAICGLFCGTCPAYPSKCHGCLSDLLTPQCTICGNGFRDCAKEHQVTRCYECESFPCERLEEFRQQHYQNGIGHHRMVIEDLAAMRTEGVSAWVERQTKDHTCPHCGALVIWYERDCHKCESSSANRE